MRGVGFDATSSLVLVDKNMKAIRYFIYRLGTLGWINILSFPSSIDPAGESQWDVMMWSDHRARDEADYINRVAKGQRVLDFVGGEVSHILSQVKCMGKC